MTKRPKLRRELTLLFQDVRNVVGAISIRVLMEIIWKENGSENIEKLNVGEGNGIFGEWL